MNTLPIILDGSKFDWYNAKAAHGMGSISDHPGFPTNGRAPAHVGVRSPRSGWTVVFKFIEIADDGEGNVSFNYEGQLPDGRYCALSLAAG